MAGKGAVCDRPSPRSLPCCGENWGRGMGVVYRAHDEVLHRDVALKVVNKGAGLDASASQNLLHEARASSSLAHPNICTIYEVGETEGASDRDSARPQSLPEAFPIKASDHPGVWLR